MKRFDNPRTTFFLVLAATALIILIDLAIWQWMRSAEMPPVVPVVTAELPVYGPEYKPFYGPDHKPLYGPERIVPKKIAQVMGPHKPVKKTKSAKDYWRDNAVPAKSSGNKARIVLIIDDMGMNRKMSYETIHLPAPLTLAYLPYAPHLEGIIKDSRAAGHELLIHMPMEPMAKLSPGPIALLSGMTAEEIKINLEKAFASFSGYVGINNHMGSKLTQDEAAMNVVMDVLAERGLIYVDSKTINSSVAGRVAADHGLSYAERDVFLDHQETLDFARHALLELEQIARKRGVAIGIGHPKVHTIQALKEWLPLAESRGFTVVPVSAVVRKKIIAAPKAEMIKAMYGPVQPPSPQP